MQESCYDAKHHEKVQEGACHHEDDLAHVQHLPVAGEWVQRGPAQVESQAEWVLRVSAGRGRSHIS